MNSRPHLTPPEASDYLRNKFGIRRAVKTLAKLRCVSSDGPIFVRVGRDILYPQDELDLYVQTMISAPMRSTSDTTPGRPSENLIAA